MRFFYTFYAILQHFCTKTCYKTLFFTRNLKKTWMFRKKIVTLPAIFVFHAAIMVFFKVQKSVINIS